MKVRNHLLSVKDYKGRWTDASDKCCPCRSCYNAHDCGYSHSYYGWVIRMECAFRHSKGCPDPIPEPVHELNRAKRCKKCNQYIII